jgi:phosphatidylglycerophosphatase A
MSALPPRWDTLLLGFVLFRLFDIAKPWPIRWADRRVPGGLGIMLDDVLAAAYAAFALHLLLPVLP